ncbi:MAG: AEC family transporter [Ignavibacterium sp.]|nr:AEC family transporter [Ignavibacterium sp.]MCX7611124.1 AEC family transporter [Ignavibacterium sp.]MDW8376011.1 AEC family transporter [Ignavibacteriales bacterium]
MIDNFLFSLNVVAPVFILILVGYISKELNFINENFVSVTSKFAFNISMPVLIFMQVSSLNLKQVVNFELIGFIYLATISSFILIWIFSIPFIENTKDRSSFIQGAFRSNFAIIGFAIISHLLGKNSLGKASILLAFVLPLYNILAVIVLTFPQRKKENLQLKEILNEILINPLIIAVVIGLIFSYWSLKLPKPISESGKLLSDLALPLALIGIGGSLNLKEIKETPTLAISASLIKIIIIPLVFTFIGYLFNFKGEDLVILFVLFASPTAIVSFIMAEAMGANGKLAGHIILISTIGSVFTFAIGIMILKSFFII